MLISMALALAAIIKANPELYNAHDRSLPLYRSGHWVGGLAVADIDHKIADECAQSALVNWLVD